MESLSSLQQLAHSLAPYLPYAAATAFLSALSIAVALTVFLKRTFQKNPKHVVKDLLSKKAENDSSILSVRGNKIREFLSLIGYYPMNPLARSFVRALTVLRENIGGHGYRYKMPWFMVIGAEKSGKTTLIDNISLPLPLGKPQLTNAGEESGCNWRFFERGVILDFHGSYFLNQNSNEALDTEWNRMFRLLSHFRVMRPLDGIVLTIPATEFVGPNKLTRDQILDRAQAIYNKLVPIEKKLGLMLPIYIVVTKCDAVPGFKAFASAVPEATRKQIFGWSAPHDPSQRFQNLWVEDAFSTMAESLRDAQLEIFMQPIDSSLKEGVMLFPSAFKKIKPLLQAYLTSIFQDVGYREAFFCRGIYFTGDTSWQPSDVAKREGQDVVDGLQPIQAYEMEHDRKIAFVHDLFQEKIFPEYILAAPGPRRVLSSSRSINVTRFAMVATFTIMSITTLHSYKFLQDEVKELLVFFRDLDKNIQLAAEADDGDGDADQLTAKFFDTQVRQLVTLMTRIEHVKFFFWMLPPSWTGNFSQDVQKALTLAYDHVFLKSLYAELLNKVNTLIREPLPYLERDNKAAELLKPLETSEFQVVYNYAREIRDLEQNIAKYNRLSEDQDINSLGEVVRYIFGFDLPKSVYENAEFYADSLGKISILPLNIDLYKEEAQSRLELLYVKFTKGVFESSSSLARLEIICKILDDLTKVKSGVLQSKVELSYFVKNISWAVSFLQNPDLSWANLTFFNPGAAYEEFLGIIQNSQLLGISVADRLSLNTTSAFKEFKERLANLKTRATGPILNFQNNELVIGPSQKFLNLKKFLTEFLEESFLKDFSSSRLKTEIPPGLNLIWKPEPLEEALDTISQYEAFLAASLPSFPPELQATFQAMGQAYMEGNLKMLLSEAQTFEMASDHLMAQSIEDELRHKMMNMKHVMPIFLAIVESLDNAHMGEKFADLRTLLALQSNQLLEEINHVLDIEALYTPVDTQFSEWNGELDAAFLSFGVSDQSSLFSYLDLQKQRARYIANEYAAPLIGFMSNKVFHMDLEEVSLISRWKLLISAVNNFDRKKQNNSIMLLDTFISNEMNTITLSNCDAKLPIVPAEPSFHEGDYFSLMLHTIKDGMRNRCTALHGKSVLSDYTKLEVFFNQRLAKRFPFVGHDSASSMGNASPQDVKAFFNLYDQLSPTTRTLLTQDKSYGSNGEKALEFLLAMEDVKTFFQGFLDDKNPGAVPSFNLEVQFRVNREKEAGANQILDWLLDVNGQKVSLFGSDSSANWTFGMPVSIEMQWAAQAPNQPMHDEKQKNLSIDGLTARFDFKGPWALLELFIKQEAPTSDLGNGIDRNPVTLVFTVPTQGKQMPKDSSSTPARAYLRLTPKTVDKDGGKPIALPFFPQSAPVLQKSEKARTKENAR
jgi:type VI secretion system protein ImpL